MDLISSYLSKVRSFPKDFWYPQILPKNEQTNYSVCFLGEFEDTKKSFRNYLIFSSTEDQEIAVSSILPKTKNIRPYFSEIITVLEN